MEALGRPCAIPYSSSFLFLHLKKLSSSFLVLTGKAKSAVQEKRQRERKRERGGRETFCVDVLLSELRRILESCNLL